ncbi:MAG: methyltransferase domain-containing protein, partial [Polyangiaceae bacterium]|nr:methyltransferase domain-containing protein [Polyangiaceae bacterium]
RILALVSEEELSIGELSSLLGDAQPTVSKQLKPLRQAGLVTVRKEGTRVFARLAEGATRDAVLADGVASGRAICASDGSLARVAELVRERDAEARLFFERSPADEPELLPPELPAYMTALACLLPRRRLAVDVGTGDGSLLEALAPAFERVYAIDRATKQLERARRRLTRRGYSHVILEQADYTDPAVAARITAEGGADAVFAARVLHHAPQPAKAFEALASLAAPGGAIVVLDYVAHHDEALREQQADLWLGFSAESLRRDAERAGLIAEAHRTIPSVRCGAGPDAHLEWQAFVARRPPSTSTERIE